MVKDMIVLLFCMITSLSAFAAETDINRIAELIDKNQLIEAKEQLQSAIRQDASNPNALLLLSSALLKENRVSQALDILQENSSILQNSPSYYNNLAYAYFYKGKDKQAINTLQRGLQQNRSYQTLHENLSIIYAFLAKKAYDKALDEPNQIQQDLPRLKLNTHIEVPRKASQNAQTPPQMADLNNETRAIRQVLVDWASGWSQQNPDKYLGFYSHDFHTPASVTFKAWKKYREERLIAPRFIEVKLSSFDIRLANDASLASVHFLQHYRSNTLNDKVIKQIVLKKEKQNWKIISENVAN